MERKLELFLFLLLFIIGGVVLINLKKKNFSFSYSSKKTHENIKSEITNFLAYEINQSQLIERVRGEKALQLESYWHLQEANISTDNIKSLFSKHSIYKKNQFVFYNNVTAVKKNGIVYKSQTAIYNTQTRKLITPNSFYIDSNTSHVKGKLLIYDLEHNITRAKNVKGTFILKK